MNRFAGDAVDRSLGASGARVPEIRDAFASLGAHECP